jgi:hypothetical protein
MTICTSGEISRIDLELTEIMTSYVGLLTDNDKDSEPISTFVGHSKFIYFQMKELCETAHKFRNILQFLP